VPDRPTPRTPPATTLRVDPAAAHDVARAYRAAPVRLGPEVVAAYDRLVRESDALFARLTAPGRPGRVRVVFTTCPAPTRTPAS
jgi:hypothetical protein